MDLHTLPNQTRFRLTAMPDKIGVKLSGGESGIRVRFAARLEGAGTDLEFMTPAYITVVSAHTNVEPCPEAAP